MKVPLTKNTLTVEALTPKAKVTLVRVTFYFGKIDNP